MFHTFGLLSHNTTIIRRVIHGIMEHTLLFCRKEKKTPNRDEINEMVAKQVKKSMEESFQTYMQKLGKRNRNESDSDSDSDHENYRMDDAGLDLEEVKVCEIHALSDLRAPPRKRQKTNNLTPVTTAFINTRLGKSRFNKIRILLDSGSSGSIILEKYVRKLRMKNDHKTVWDTKGGTFRTSKKCKTTFILNEFFQNKAIEWNLHVDSTPGPHRYDMILGRDVMSELGITLDFKDQTMTWDDSTVNMKDPDTLSDLLDPVNDFYWNEDLNETEALQEASARLKKILDAKYEAADLDEVVRACEYLDSNEQQQLLALLRKYEHLFDGTLGTWNNEPYDIELKDGAKPYHSRPFPIPKVHERTLKIELERLVKIGVLKRKNNSEWAAPTFIIPKKDGSVRFISDFRELNKRIKRKPFPIPKIQDLLLKLEGFQYATSLDLNMGYYHIELMPFSKSLCTIVMPWGKYEYQRLPMGLCNTSRGWISPSDIFPGQSISCSQNRYALEAKAEESHFKASIGSSMVHDGEYLVDDDMELEEQDDGLSQSGSIEVEGMLKESVDEDGGNLSDDLSFDLDDFFEEHDLDEILASAAHARPRRSVDAEHLSRIWQIDLDTAKKTLDVTSQNVPRASDPTLSRNYAMNDKMLRYNHISEHFFMDTFFVTKKAGKSSRGHTCCQLFVTDKGFIYVVPMKSKSEVLQAVKQFAKEIDGILHLRNDSWVFVFIRIFFKTLFSILGDQQQID